MIPWLLVLQLMSQRQSTLKELVHSRMQLFPCSGEVNFRVEDISGTIQRVVQSFEGEYCHLDETDGVSLEFLNVRMNIRASNTEPLLRVNIESRGDAELVSSMMKQVSDLIELKL